MKTLSSNESLLKGEWIFKDDQISSNEECGRIQWLVTDILRLIRVDRSGWEKLYQDPKDKRYWLLYYPHSEMHGGGPPSLMEMSYKEAKLRFNANNT